MMSKKYSPEEATELMNIGIWMKSGGYTHRNMGNNGQYLAYGDYPENIRGCKPHTLEEISLKGSEWEVADLDEQSRTVSTKSTRFVFLQEQLDAAVDYIHIHNPHVFSRKDVHDSIMDTIIRHVGDEKLSFVGTMGYTVRFTQDYPDQVDVEILVDPALGVESAKYVTMEGDRVINVEYVD